MFVNGVDVRDRIRVDVGVTDRDRSMLLCEDFSEAGDRSVLFREDFSEAGDRSVLFREDFSEAGDRSMLFREDLSEVCVVLPQTLPLMVGGVMDLDRGFIFSEVDVIEGWIEGNKYSEKVGDVFGEIGIAMSLMAGEDALGFMSTGINSMSLMAGQDALGFMSAGGMVPDFDDD